MIKIKERKDFKNKFDASLKIKSINDEDVNYFSFEGYASTFNNLDYDLEVILSGAFKNTIEDWEKSGEKIPMLWQHDRTEPIGVFTDLEETKEGLKVIGKMPKSDSFVSSRVIPQMSIGSIRSMSIGFTVVNYFMETEDEKGVVIYYFKELGLKEISLVTMPANPKAVITSLKFEDLKEKEVRDLEKILTTGVKFSNKVAKTIISSLKQDRIRDDSSANGDDWIEKENVFDLYNKEIDNILKI